MKKLLWLSIAAVVLLAGGIELRLVAGGAEEQAEAREKGAFRASPRHVQAAQSMLEAAKKAYEGTVASYEAGTAAMPGVHTWSRSWLEAERGLAKNRQEQRDALLGHWRRMKSLNGKVEALYRHGIRGGEVEKYFATKYYLAQAELWLLDAGGKVPGDED